MNWAWWDGRMSVDLYQKEHPLAYQEMLEPQAAESQTSEPEDGIGDQPAPAPSGDD
jgi:hypothetical protein